MLELSDKGFRMTVLNMFKEIKEENKNFAKMQEATKINKSDRKIIAKQNF